MRNPGLIGGGDVHHRHTVGGLVESGIAFGDVDAIGKGRQQRLPRQEAAQEVTQQTLRSINGVFVIVFHP
ncbi:hypothetical protein D3C73_1394710 [compost metagenome]